MSKFSELWPFEDKLSTLSYINIIWYMKKLTTDDKWAMEWCDWAMFFAERKFVFELIGFGYGLSLDMGYPHELMRW